MDTKAPRSKEMIEKYMAHCAEEKGITHLTFQTTLPGANGGAFPALTRSTVLFLLVSR